MVNASTDFFQTARIIEIDTGEIKSELLGHEGFVTVALFVPAVATPALQQLLHPEVCSSDATDLLIELAYACDIGQITIMGINVGG